MNVTYFFSYGNSPKENESFLKNRKINRSQSRNPNGYFY